uniref:Rubicon Homology domain-containing protein n=1 Tax=Arion vulgaris TaxID=1028688 RepID=A0A0B7AW37_9EUPU
MGLEYPIINVQRHRDSETPDPKKNSVVNIIDPSIESALNVNDIAVEPSLYVNISGNSNSALDDVINSPVSCQSVPSSSVSKTEISIKILPETQQLPRNLSYPSVHSDKESLEKSNVVSLPSSEKQKPKIFTARSDPSISMSDPLLSNTLPPNLHYSYVENPSPGPYSPIRPWVDVDLYQESMSSPGSSPLTRSLSGALKSSGNVYIPQTPVQGTSDPNPATSSGNIHSSGVSKLPTSNHPPPPSTPSSRKLGHKRWVSDTSTIRVDQFHQADVSDQPSSSTSAISQNSIVRQQNGQARRRASEFEPPSYQGTLTKPTEGQSLMSYLTSQDFNTCANLEKENAHFRICEALIEAFESMKFNRMLKRQETGKSKSSSGSSSDEEIQELRQRIRIRKREKMMAKGRPFPSLSDEQTDTATNSQTASSTVSSKNDFSSLSGDSETDEEEEDEGNIDLTNAELQRSNQQIEKNSSYDESMNPGSAEFIAISLLRKFSEKHLPKASELKWLVSEGDAPQRLLPLPLSTPVSPDDAENADLSVNRTRLRGNLEWAPPRAQIIFSVHIPEKRAAVMNRQNFRCAGCGMKVDPAFMKRYRYCEYLGKYFCQCCHTGETSIIPGRVIEKWDFSRYPIANFSYTLLEKMWQEPLFHVDTINPTLYKRVRGLESIRESRQQLIHLHSLLAVCKRDSMLIKEMQKMPSHWISNDDAYSMDDFAQVRSGAMLNYLKSFTSLAVVHVSDCQLCQGLGFICGMCQDQQVIFPFQLENVIKCPVCQSCYHKDCFIPGKCPKCIRLEARLFSDLASHLQPLRCRLLKMKGKLLSVLRRKFSSQHSLAVKNEK